MAKKYNIEIDEVERKALVLSTRLFFAKLEKLKKPTPRQKKLLSAVDKLYIFFKNL